MDIEWDEKEIVEIDLVRLQEAYRNNILQFVHLDQLKKFHKVYLNSTTGATSRSNNRI
jgi:hypothetical protein